MSLAPGVNVIYSFKYRGVDEEWSQLYHFTGDHPTDDAGWIALIAALLPLCQVISTDRVKIVRAYGYNTTDPHHAADYVYETADHGGVLTGDLNTSIADVAPGDAASWVRWKTGRTNTHGKPIYLRKYFHSAILSGESDDDQDTLDSTYKADLAAFGATVLAASGDWPGLAGPDGVAPPGPIVASTFVTTRTLKRRGKRPT